MQADHALVPNHDGEEDDLDVSYRAHAGHPGVDDDYVRTGLGGLDDDPEMNGGDMSRYDPSTMTRLADGGGGGQDGVSGGGRWRKFVMIGVALATLVGGVAIFGSRKSSSSATSTEGVVGGGGGANDDASTSGRQPPPPPANLEQVCNVKIISQSTKLFEKCEEYCEAAACCTEPVTHPFSCILGNEEVCDLYNDSCEHLYRLKQDDTSTTTTTSLPKAPGSLPKVCTNDHISSSVEGLAECEDACLPAQCCFAATSSCRETLQQDCQTYQDCSVLYQDNHNDETTDNDDDEDQDTSDEGTDEDDNDNDTETEANDEGDDGDDGDDDFFDDDDDANAEDHDDDDQDGEDEKDGDDGGGDDDIFDDDDDDDLGDDDDDDLGDDDDDDFFNDDDDGGDNNDDDDDEGDHVNKFDGLQLQVNAMCSETAIATEDGKEDCKRMCDVAICCFLEEGAAHGLDPTLRAPCGIEPDSQEWCSQYKGCLILITDNHLTDQDVANADGTTTPTATDISTLCSATSLATTSGRQDCASKCAPSKCCFSFADDDEEGEATCSVDCSLYEGCAAVFDDDIPDASDEDHSIGDENQTMPSVSTQKTEIDLVCQNVVRDPQTQDDANINAACLALCQAGACCFDNDSGCDNDDTGVDCYDFMGCYPMYQDDNTPNDDDDDDDDTSAAKVVVDSVCHEDSLNEVGGAATEACQTVCAHGACCFQSSEDTCFQWGVSVKCHDYMGCSVLHAADSLSETKSAIAEACSADNLANPGGRDECEGLCSPSECCYAPMGDSCLDAGVDVNCHDFMDCIVLHPAAAQQQQQEDTNGGAVQSQRKKIIDTVCSEEGRAIPDGTKACAALCESASCCYDADNDGDCATDCFDFTGCYPVFATNGSSGGTYDNDGAVSAQDIAKACSTDKITTSAGIDECTALCLSAGCCFDDADGSVGGEDGCLDKGKDVDCNKFAGCQAVFSLGRKDDTDADKEATPSSTELRRAIDQACDESNLQTATGKAECDKLCLGGACCHDDSSDNVCDARVDCYSYFGCPTDTSQDDVDVDHDNNNDSTEEEVSRFRSFVDSTCSEVALASPGGHDACEAACAPGACCFNAHPDGGNCFETNSQVNCLDYSTCVKVGILQPMDPTPSDPFITMVESKCTREALSGGGRADCESVCKDGACCFLDGADTCAVAGINVDCHQFQKCAILHQDDDDENDNVDTTDNSHDLRAVIKAACTEESITMPGRPSACQMLCEKGSCCFDDDNAKCQQDDIDCYDYMDCRDVYKGADNR